MVDFTKAPRIVSESIAQPNISLPSGARARVTPEGELIVQEGTFASGGGGGTRPQEQGFAPTGEFVSSQGEVVSAGIVQNSIDELKRGLQVGSFGPEGSRTRQAVVELIIQKQAVARGTFPTSIQGRPASPAQVTAIIKQEKEAPPIEARPIASERIGGVKEFVSTVRVLGSKEIEQIGIVQDFETRDIPRIPRNPIIQVKTQDPGIIKLREAKFLAEIQGPPIRKLPIQQFESREAIEETQKQIEEAGLSLELLLPPAEIQGTGAERRRRQLFEFVGFGTGLIANLGKVVEVGTQRAIPQFELQAALPISIATPFVSPEFEFQRFEGVFLNSEKISKVAGFGSEFAAFSAVFKLGKFVDRLIGLAGKEIESPTFRSFLKSKGGGSGSRPTKKLDKQLRKIKKNVVRTVKRFQREQSRAERQSRKSDQLQRIEIQQQRSQLNKNLRQLKSQAFTRLERLELAEIKRRPPPSGVERSQFRLAVKRLRKLEQEQKTQTGVTLRAGRQLQKTKLEFKAQLKPKQVAPTRQTGAKLRDVKSKSFPSRQSQFVRIPESAEALGKRAGTLEEQLKIRATRANKQIQEAQDVPSIQIPDRFMLTVDKSLKGTRFKTIEPKKAIPITEVIPKVKSAPKLKTQFSLIERLKALEQLTTIKSLNELKSKSALEFKEVEKTAQAFQELTIQKPEEIPAELTEEVTKQEIFDITTTDFQLPPITPKVIQEEEERKVGFPDLDKPFLKPEPKPPPKEDFGKEKNPLDDFPDIPKLLPKLPPPKKLGLSVPESITGFDVFGIQKDKPVRLNERPLTRNQALALLAKEVDNTTSASGFIRKAKEKVDKPFSDPKPDLRKFRLSKKKKDRIVEKNKFRIDTFGEIQGIPLKAAKLRKQGLLDIKKGKRIQI